MSKVIFLTSSGVDSFCMWRLFSEKYPHAIPVYFRLGHRYQSIEVSVLERLEYLASEKGIKFKVEFSDIFHLTNFETPIAYIPYRNLLLFCGAGLLGADIVLLGSLKGEYSKDKSNKFIKNASSLLSYIDEKKLALVNPVGKYTKTSLVKKYIEEFPKDIDLLLSTHSCYNNQGRCGQCMACFRRWVAFYLNGLDEDYQNPPWQWGYVKYHGSWWKKLLKSANKLDLIVNNYQAFLALRKKVL